MDFTFEWDRQKADANLRKHNVTFQEARTVFADPTAITIADNEHSNQEPRFVEIGRSALDRLLVVAYTERGQNIRIISCRRAERKERSAYEKTRT